MNDEMLEFLMYYIMQERIKRNIKNPINIKEIIKIIKIIIEAYEEEVAANYEEDISDDEIESIEYDSILDTWENEVDDIDDDFIREKIEQTISYNCDYFAAKGDNIYFNFNISHAVIKNKVDLFVQKLPDSFLENIESDVELSKLIGITFREKELDTILKNEKQLQKLYFGTQKEDISLLSCYITGASNETVIKEIKKKLLFSKILWFNYFSSLKNRIEYNDSFTYLFSKEQNYTSYPIKSDDLSEEDIEDDYHDAFLDTLFILEDNGPSLASEKLELGIINCGNPLIENKNDDDSYWSEKENFYVTFLYFLEEEIKKINGFDEEIKDYLLLTKFKLMETLDYVCNLTLFQSAIPTKVLKTFPDSGHLSFVLIDDILNYSDESYQSNYDSQNFAGRVHYINNIIKKLIIKTYYFLSEDKEIEEYIKENPNYKKNTISSSLLEDALDTKKNLTLKKIK